MQKSGEAVGAKSLMSQDYSLIIPIYSLQFWLAAKRMPISLACSCYEITF